nr:DUF202 domain-containing protein [Thermoanaerobacterales bacterium]
MRTDDEGTEPDYRFTLANERTFLAWIRTALALLAGGLAIAQFLPPLAVPYLREAVAIALMALGAACAVRAVDRISFEVRRGESVAIIGPSGCGKSSLLNILGCLDRPTEGTYRLGGRDVAELCRRAAEQKGLHLTCSAQGEYPVIRADEGLVRQAILNLIDNAVKYTEPGGRIHVSVDRDGDGVRLLVKDTGVGIPRDSLTRVFERFYRVDKARSRREGGTGLGLSIVKHIVESHKG